MTSCPGVIHEFQYNYVNSVGLDAVTYRLLIDFSE